MWVSGVRRWLPLGLLSLALGCSAPPSDAAIPPVVDGQPLPSLAPMLSKVTPAVVNISTKTRVRSANAYFDDPVFRQFFGLQGTPRERVEQSLGSGVVVDAAKGYVLTNNHVVGGADDIQVTLQDGRSFTGRLIGSDPDTDVALVKIDADRLTALPVGASDALRVGDFVVAVGDPFGLGQTATSGMVSALGRSGLGSKGYQNFIQTDASINPGNSGGALVNLRGELVGINSMIFSPSGGNVGIGFAIPSNLASQVMGQLLKFGKVRRGTLGLEVQDVTARVAKALGVPAGQGAVVTSVAPGTPADVAGVQVGDVVDTLDGKAVRSAQDVRNAEGLLPLDASVKLSISRGEQTRQVSAKIEPEKLASVEGSAIDPRLAGVVFSDLAGDQRNDGAFGVAITSVKKGSPAGEAGLQAGDIVVGVGQRRVTNVKALRVFGGGQARQLLLTVVRNNSVYYVVL
jgi:Do/DeqQ family serine protease